MVFSPEIHKNLKLISKCKDTSQDPAYFVKCKDVLVLEIKSNFAEQNENTLKKTNVTQ